VLRGELGFGGAVIADDMSMRGAVSGGTPAERVHKALDAGCDLVLLCNSPEQVEATLTSLEGYVSPPGQLRLMRLRGQSHCDWSQLRETKQWQQACRRIAALGERPTLRLES
jgi:beta-N-acetylhexosaminidase